MTKLFVKPKEGLTVINPLRNKPFLADGEEVEMTSQVKRYIKFGDLVLSKKPKKKTNPKEND
jgi:hypothetical protein